MLLTCFLDSCLVGLVVVLVAGWLGGGLCTCLWVGWLGDGFVCCWLFGWLVDVLAGSVGLLVGWLAG